MLVLALNFSFGQLTHTIELTLNPATGLLSDPGPREVNKGDYVVWKIKTDENIYSFKIVGAGHPFRTDLPRGDDYSLIGRTVARLSHDTGWKYAISYRLKRQTLRREIDPKISVRPRLITLTEVLSVLGFIATFITSIIFFRRWRKAAAELKVANNALKNK